MTKPYRDYVEQLKAACQQNEINPAELISYVDAGSERRNGSNASKKRDWLVTAEMAILLTV